MGGTVPKRYRSGGDTVSDLTGPGPRTQTSNANCDVQTTEPTVRDIQQKIEISKYKEITEKCQVSTEISQHYENTDNGLISKSQKGKI